MRKRYERVFKGRCGHMERAWRGGVRGMAGEEARVGVVGVVKAWLVCGNLF